MNIIKPVVRNMREELAKAGTPRDTDEIRVNYDMTGLGFRVIKTFHDRGDKQNRHVHLLLEGGHHVHDGVIEVQDGSGEWTRIEKGNIVWYGAGDMYNARVPADAPQMTYPGAGHKTGAVTDFYKSFYGLDLKEGEDELLLKYDWFSEGVLTNHKDPEVSPVFRVAEKAQKKFWEIVARNREKFDAECKFAYKPMLDEMIDYNLERYQL